MKSQQKRTPAKKPRPKMSNTNNDDVIDISGYGAVPPDYANISYSSGIDTITIDPLDSITLTGGGSMNTITLPSSSYVTSIGGSTISYTGTGSSYNWNNTSSTVNISTDGIDMAAGTDLKIDGKSLKEFMSKMEQRLSILVPDPVKLEKFEALKRAYEHYKTMEALCFPENEEENKQ